MNNSSKDEHIELPALNGDNPLGFLAALGVVTALHQTGEKEIQLSWKRNVSWTPSLHGFIGDKSALVKKLAIALKDRTVSTQLKSKRDKAQKSLNEADKALSETKIKLKNNKQRIKKLNSDRKETFLIVEENSLLKGEEKLRKEEKDRCSQGLLEVQKQLVLSCKETEYRSFACELLRESELGNRLIADMLCAFGSDAIVSEKNKESRIKETWFCFIKGSGRQWFLDTALQLVNKVTTTDQIHKATDQIHKATDQIRKALFEDWDYSDEGLSMRWDPLDDRRYALMDRDPTASDNKSRTVWMANLLAYRALALFPSAPVKGQLETTGWSRLEESKKKRNVFTWPIWEKPIGVETIRSLLQHSELTKESPSLKKLIPLGVCAGFRSKRIQVGQEPNQKTNFSPAAPV